MCLFFPLVQFIISEKFESWRFSTEQVFSHTITFQYKIRKQKQGLSNFMLCATAYNLSKMSQRSQVSG